METNNQNLSVATPLFSWRDYRKVFFIMLMGLAPILVAVQIIHFINLFFYRGSDFFSALLDGHVFEVIPFYLVVIGTIMGGEAFLALVFANKWSTNMIYMKFILHVIVWLSLLVLTFVVVTGDGSPELFIAFGVVTVVGIMYGLLRMIVWHILYRKNPDKSISLFLSKLLLSRPLKFYVVLFVVGAVGAFLS